MDSNTVVIFGAGATKACGGPLTNEILFRGFTNEYQIDREDFLGILNSFLTDNFFSSVPETYPSLPLLISFLDTAIDRNHALNAEWGRDKLIKAREALDYVIFAVLEHDLKRLQNNYYLKFYQNLYGHSGRLPVTISLNYDIIADNAISRWNDENGNYDKPFPDYMCDIATDFYKQKKGEGRLLKLHGSLNWLYCPSCNRMDVGISKSGRHFAKVLDELYQEVSLEQMLTCHGRPCRGCGAEVQPVMISPTYFKDYRNPHISRIWYEADQVLRKAERVIFIGYSLPDDDLDVLYLLKRGLSHLSDNQIHVVEYDENQRPLDEHPVGLRFATLFGTNINWYINGFEGFINEFNY
ncbi:MAG: hypothetical protein GY744_08855 [Gammaproteobacteria bacterium]|nr:hypothetical protein [Gammaproteobacteria bacterium]